MPITRPISDLCSISGLKLELGREQARHDYHLDDVATKRDMKELETALKHEVELLSPETGRMIAETNQRIYESKADLTRWIVGAGFLQTTLIIGVLLKITHLI